MSPLQADEALSLARFPILSSTAMHWHRIADFVQRCASASLPGSGQPASVLNTAGIASLGLLMALVATSHYHPSSTERSSSAAAADTELLHENSRPGLGSLQHYLRSLRSESASGVGSVACLEWVCAQGVGGVLAQC